MSTQPTVAYIFERYPVLSQAFLRREVAGVCAQGVHVEIYSMFPPSAADRIHTLPGVPVDYFRWWEAGKLIVALPRELRRDPTLLRDGWRLYHRYRPTNSENFWTSVWAALFAVCRAHRLRRHKPDVIHGVWATGPATAAAILGRLCGVPFSFGGHAYDIYRHGGDAFLEPKLRAAGFVHTTTEASLAYLRERAGGAAVNILLARRGLDRLPPKSERDTAARPIRLLSISRLVAKKGHDHQLAACALLKSWGVPFVAKIVGDGPLRDKLQRRIDRDGLGGLVILCGALPPEQVGEQYRWADILWHTGVVDAEGDRDGLPNVIPEAFAHCLPVISSRMAGPMEAVAHEMSGLIVDVTNASELAAAVKRLAEDSLRRRRFGENGRRWVEENFLITRNTEVLARAFREISGQPART
ncbi:MAG: glycosyltransferase [Verrucomicrobiia bacterium]|jgi:glycosyltransferase involved in cell wall biosynthesis